MDYGLSYRFTWARELTGLTRLALHKKSGVSLNNILALEKGGKIDFAPMIFLSKYLDVSPDWLINGRGNPAESYYDRYFRNEFMLFLEMVSYDDVMDVFNFMKKFKPQREDRPGFCWPALPST
ncbi:helix-turn-helix domain-containing protein [Agarilytica rhodophyticola]|uniref:helix-turn-helix domain-containing protein n=1 Tax=Agarilytica rhodophyticola TaxID=1737490 RepID=UPI0013150A88|nr:helix-turn-helix transcriptional regulator [Agarilytica rhodophyticola]